MGNIGDHDPFKSPKRPWHRKRETGPAHIGRYDVGFYKRKTWQGVRTQKLWNNPYCEVSEAFGMLVDGDHVDHTVPRSKGGSDFNPENLMTLSEYVHGVKSGHERVKGCLVQTRSTYDGLIPVRHEDIIEVLGKLIWGVELDHDRGW